MTVLDASPQTVSALKGLAAVDADLARAIDVVGQLPERRREPGFAALTKIVVQQQLSLASAAAIWPRLEAAAQPFSPQTILSLSEDEMRALGLSRQKTAYCRNLAVAVGEGTVDLPGLDRMADGEAIAHLVQVTGIGRWTAEIYLLFALGRPNVWPAGDLALQLAAQDLKSLPERPQGKVFDAMAEPWRPWRGVAARLLWQYYRATRGKQAGVGQ